MYAKVYVEITNICNMNCSFCHGHHRSPRRMSREEFSRILDALSGVTEYIYYHVMGEPLTHPELPEFLRMAAARGFKSIVTTNGTLLSARGEALLLSTGLHKVNISLHSFEEGSEQDFVRYIDGVAEFVARAADGGVIVSLRLWNRNFDGGRNGRIEDMLRERLPGDWAENTRGIRIREKLHLEWGERFAWPDSDAPLQGESVFCYGLRDHFGILCDGTVVPCCLDSEGGIALGNIFTGEIGKILASPRAETMRRGFSCRRASEELCRRCGYAQRFAK
ncbi:MAG: radical SAM protein [Clostridia bacterium]|nr:radical SAM protein [Clostridia bacterium]